MDSDEDDRLYAYRRFGSEPLGVGCFGKTYKCLHITVTGIHSVDSFRYFLDKQDSCGKAGQRG